MKALKILTAVTLASAFSLSATAGDLSQYDYEDFVQSASWPTDSYRLKKGHTSFADIERMLENSPTAIGASHVGGEVLMVDLLGEDIHRQ